MTRTNVSKDLQTLRDQLRVMLFLAVAISFRSAELSQPPPLAEKNAIQVPTTPADPRMIEE